MADVSFADRMKELQPTWLLAHGYDRTWYEDKWTWVLKESEKTRNLFDHDWWSFIKGREHRWARSLQSSQCFAVNVFAPACTDPVIARTILMELAPGLDVRPSDDVGVTFEATPEGATEWLGESSRQPTQVDVLFEVRRDGKPHGWLPVEVKFTETEPGACRGAAGPDKDGRGNQEPDRCRSLWRVTENPAANCYMVASEGRRYWDLMRAGPHPFDFTVLAGEPCPFRHGLYQIMRNHVLGTALLANRGGEWSRVGTCFHEGNEQVRRLPESVGGQADLIAAFNRMVPGAAVVELHPAIVVATVAARFPQWADWAHWVAGRYALESVDVRPLEESPVPPEPTAGAPTKTTDADSVELIGSHARSFLVEAPRPTGFWARVKESFKAGMKPPQQLVNAATPSRTTPADYEAIGYEPFCRMHGYLLLTRFEPTMTSFVLFWREELLRDVSWPDPAGRAMAERAALLAHLYSDAVEDDWRIDSNEAGVLHAVVKALGLTEDDVRTARRGVMFALAAQLVEDRSLSSDESSRLNTLRDVLSITDADFDAARQAAFLVAVASGASGDRACSVDVATAERLAAELRVGSPETRETIARLKAKAFANDLREGRVPVLSQPPVTLRRGEVAHYEAAVKVIQQKTKVTTHRGYVGTRVNLGGMPLYLGASKPFQTSQEVMTTVGSGQFVVTNQRVVVIGTKLNYSIKLEAILGIEEFSDAIQIHDEGRYGGRIYLMENPRMALMLLDHLRQQPTE